MKRLYLLCFCLANTILLQAQSTQRRPNLIVFLVDDMGWMDTSVPFGDSATALNKRYHTPNMERLAREGVKFTNAYAAPTCTPSRTSMLTGMNPAHSRITNWTSPAKNNNTDNKDNQMGPADWNYNGLSPVPGIEHTVYATPFPQLMKDAGYFTIHVGKAHWGSAGTPGANPYNLGFCVNISGHSAGHPQSYLGTENYGNRPGKISAQAVPDLAEYYGSDTFLTEALTLEAIKSLDAPIKNKQPFFLNMSHYAVHDPITGDKRFLQRYYDSGLDTIEAKYASLIEGMDKSLGDLMEHLKKRGVEKNTIVIFMSDNGGLSLTPQRGGKRHTQNLPLRAGKGSVYEGGIREPMIVKWPGVTKPGEKTDQYVAIEDFFPTILEMAGIKKYKTVQTIDGRSIVPILRNTAFSDNQRCLIWHVPNKWQGADGPGINYHSAIRQGQWKLVYNMRTGNKELYNLKQDIGEHHNLADQTPDKVNALSLLLGKQLRNWNAVMPFFKETGQPVPWPDRIK